MTRRRFLICSLGAVPAAFMAGRSEGATGPEREYQRIVVFSDIHLPGRNLAAKEQAVAEINRWKDVDLVAVTGDIVATGGDASEYALAKEFFKKLTKPASFIGGNHDYIYPDQFVLNPETGHHFKEKSPELRARKLQRFKETWGLPELFYSRRMDHYLLVFLSPDALTGNDACRMTLRQLQWLRSELQRNKQLATMIFFHGPLTGTGIGKIDDSEKSQDSPYAEPSAEIHGILKENPQVFLWVSGHVHIAPTNEDFKAPRNLYDQRVMVIHNPDMNGTSRLHNADASSTKHNDLWTNSLFLYRDRVEVKTFDHKRREWLRNLDRTIVRANGHG